MDDRPLQPRGELSVRMDKTKERFYTWFKQLGMVVTVLRRSPHTEGIGHCFVISTPEHEFDHALVVCGDVINSELNEAWSKATESDTESRENKAGTFVV